MSNKNFDIYFDCGLSKIRGIALDKADPKNNFCIEKNFFSNFSILESDIQEIINGLEIETNEYLNDVSLMIDSSKMLLIGISTFRKFDGSKLKKDSIQFLIQDAKQQILRNYSDYNIAHIMIKNYKIDNVDHAFFPDEINCNLISIDIDFICLPKSAVDYFKNEFFKLNISINQIHCSSYVKSLNYINNYPLVENINFIDIGFKKTAIICYDKNTMRLFDVLPLGGNHITQDLSRVLDINLKDAEEFKLSFDQEGNFINKTIISSDLIQQIIIARIEEIIKLCVQSIKSNNHLEEINQTKFFLIGEGSKILNNKLKKNIAISEELELIDEKLDDICKSVARFNIQRNKQEVVIVPKKQINQGFFEKLFHLFK